MPEQQLFQTPAGWPLRCVHMRVVKTHFGQADGAEERAHVGESEV